MTQIYTFIRSENQKFNSNQYIREHVKNAKVSDLYMAFHKRTRISKGLIFLKFFFQNLMSPKQIILGDFRLLPLYIRILLYFCVRVILVDDGISTFWFYRDRRHLRWKKKLIFYSKYAVILRSLYGDFETLIEQSFKKKPKKVGENVIIIGGPYVENGWIDHDQYISLIYKIKSIFYNREVLYFPHPRETAKELENLKIKIVDTGGQFTEKLTKYSVSKTVYISFFSSGLIDAFIESSEQTFLFIKLPNYKKREDEHLFGFNVEKAIYDLFLKIGFEELKI